MEVGLLQTVTNMLANGKMAPSMVRAPISGLVAIKSLENLKMEKLMASWLGITPTETNMKVKKKMV